MYASLSRQDLELPLINHITPHAEGLDTDKEDHLKHRRLCRWHSGWKFTLFLASAASILVLTFNVAFLLWAVARDHGEETSGTVYEGDCDKVQPLSTGLHLLINIFSTILLGASNYVMQCLCAPTRKDINRAHHQGTWLDIGVLSLRNLSLVSRKRLLMWICLAFSSLPLHLIYNSAIFSTTAVYAYDVFAGHESLGTKNQADLEFDHRGRNLSDAFWRFHQKAQNGSLLHLDSSECLDAFLTYWQTRYAGVLLVTDNVSTTNHYDFVRKQGVFHPTKNRSERSFVCWSDGDLACAAGSAHYKSDAENHSWIVHGSYGTYLVDSCLVEKAPGRCKLRYSLPLMIVVIIANVIKAVVICYITVTTADLPLLTSGDAVASFLHQPDTYSLGRCLVSCKEVEWLHTASWTSWDYQTPMPFGGRQRRRYSTVPCRQWVLLVLLWLIFTAIAVLLLVYGALEDSAGIWNAKFGSIHAQSLIHGNNWYTSLIENTMIANLLQVIFSTLYFAFNSIMTGMALATEWSQYAISRKGLRVSWNPEASQHSSYFLSLPYHYTIPHMASSAILHWLISQSIYLVGVEAYNTNLDPYSTGNFFTCGYTPVTIVISLSLGLFMLIFLLAIGRKKLPSGMPVAGSCSLAIAAACHPKYDPNLAVEDHQEGMELRPVKWGIMTTKGPIGHCAFSSAEVNMPEVGHLYQ